MLDFIYGCISGRSARRPHPSTDPRSPESIASAIVTKILNADEPYSLHKELNEEFSTDNWTDAIAQAILRGLENAIQSGADMARAASDAATQSRNAAVDFATDHPVYATLIALGILALLTPWALEVLGFGELGPIEGSFAAAWQRTHAGYVPRNALFGYFQRLGMKRHWA
ncbi:hypothetical protein PEX1_090460 [Penicillium expansum]|uniref:Uncharacterized protein n=1 Tax=Penicillium expansum TaxID=27334 RepID=A0A0A2I3U6_PENEN|nr:hypothetical protein PEX2_104830 [Penicillium expansum]KGO37799.1 hypothetical protein PEXP_078150 [Penicillium expansum]KGO49850.1 hypothetical protein PEX2_104830 [Penicillium expansum]KGO65364.1 hypothetical protein PEX1_090460 [Penicillium expansum]